MSHNNRVKLEIVAFNNYLVNILNIVLFIDFFFVYIYTNTVG